MHHDSDTLIDIRTSGIHGLGAFAARRIEAGQQIGRYDGRRYAGDEADREWDHALTYVFGLSDGSFIDGSDGGNATRHLNHSCEPNCVAYEVEDEHGVPQIVIEARRRIQRGEELFIDYALDVGQDASPLDYPCCCGTPSCRGTMLAPAEPEASTA